MGHVCVGDPTVAGVETEPLDIAYPIDWDNWILSNWHFDVRDWMPTIRIILPPRPLDPEFAYHNRPAEDHLGKYPNYDMYLERSKLKLPHAEVGESPSDEFWIANRLPRRGGRIPLNVVQGVVVNPEDPATAPPPGPDALRHIRRAVRKNRQADSDLTLTDLSDTDPNQYQGDEFINSDEEDIDSDISDDSEAE